MASQSPPGGDGPLSFAKIAAMAATSNPQISSASDENNICQQVDPPSCAEAHDSGVNLPSQHTLDKTPEANSIDLAVDDLGRGVQDIGITLNKHRAGSGSFLGGQENGLLKRENSFDDDRTHLSTSSTKMTSFDSKSLASVTTFAMDEKDSVRPDDSASVQAIDEEDALSGPASGAPNSLAGSEADSRAYRDHFRDGIPLRPRGILPVSGPLFNDTQSGNGAIPPDSVANNFVISANPDSIQDGQNLHGFPLDPDEKLLEAMKSPKDRLLILQLEEKIRHFIKDSSEQSLELPPSNAFGRLLAHKLGDYYHLTHFVDNNVTSVRLHRTPFCRLPTPLAMVHASTHTTPPPTVPAMKIMRRNDGDRTDGSIGGSSAPSKATSEAGDSGQDGERNGSSSGATPAKDRMNLTREEREAKYHEARERIFRDFPDSAKSDTASGESNPNMSRSSSVNGRKKNQKQRPHDDSFEVRSQFNAYYPGMQYANGSAPYNVAVNDNSYSNQVPYLVGPGVPPPSGGYLPSSQNGAMYPGQMQGQMHGQMHGQMQGQIPNQIQGQMPNQMQGQMNMNGMHYPMTMSPQMTSNGSWQGGNMPQQSPYPGYASMNQPVMSQQSSNKSSPAMNNYAVPNTAPYQQNPNWNSPSYPANYQQPQPQRNGPPVHWPGYPQHQQSMPPNIGGYPYAQYPGQHMSPAMQNAAGSHAMQAGYANARSHFNPQTRSFIPGGAPLGRHPSKIPQHAMRPYANMQTSVQGQWTGYHEGPQNRNMDPAANMIPNRVPVSGPRDSIAKWGTPSHLPPKPPPSEVPSEFDMNTRNVPPSAPAPSYANGIPSVNNGPLVVSGGTTLSKPN
ncbi:uncharacterized protein N7446_011579 [Penicillium canescens]|uniref:R3H domain-containing protein n=1 Tax=Penicillium canescens TaxID=5083 RepID=A0AAD6NAX8_PENCN|nr:uncharacterized protein N7446_011579 [Penicillium canescens]KAJ6029078.1 hypothetical protein N7444_012065 [Penicillium canescens]KAJ6047510.1 hypothetical protein N7460_003657 [Penicillium canescens]KAJ6048896.1 hypothetical protein N7446_011579 [Penicillium canescens]